MKLYDIIYADPPWDYKGQTQHGGKGVSDSGSALAHYPTMTVDQMIDEIKVPAKDNALLFMWTSSPHLDQAIKLGVGWGFKYATVAFVWDKQRVNPGFYTMSQCELCLVFKKGKIPENRGTRNEKQLVSEERREHSRKPDEVRERIVKMFPKHDRLEMFARSSPPGWDVMGNEVEKFS
jgi:N6-adenosine-specific RNA methylase IME4